MARLTGVLVLLSLLGAAGPARAQAVADELPEGPWYGWQVIAADAAAVTLLFAPVSERMGPLARGMGMIALVMDAPIIHMAHRNSRSAAVSLARLPLLLFGRLLGSLVGDAACSQLDCANTAPVLGSAIGIAPVMLYDWISARRPGRLFYAHAAGAARMNARRPPAPPRLAGWVPTIPLLAGSF
jgi:hypothetical protein